MAKMEDSLEEVHEELLAWAENEGVEIESIRPMRLSGRGFGSKSEVGSSLCDRTDMFPP